MYVRLNNRGQAMINQASVASNRNLSLIVPIVNQTEIGFQRLTTIRCHIGRVQWRYHVTRVFVFINKNN